VSITLFIWKCNRCGFLPYLRETVLKVTRSEQQDCAPPYYAVSGTEYIGNRFNGRRIGHGYDVVSPKSKPNNTWQFVLGRCGRKLFPNSINKILRPKNSYQEMLQWLPCQYARYTEEHGRKINICTENGGEHTDNLWLAGTGTSWPPSLMAQQPLVGQGLLIIETLRSHHTW
jgi:hypothetical protein